MSSRGARGDGLAREKLERSGLGAVGGLVERCAGMAGKLHQKTQRTAFEILLCVERLRPACGSRDVGRAGVT